MTDVAKRLATINKAAELFRTTPGRRGSVVHLESGDDLMVVGDLHGNLDGFREVLRIAELDLKPGRHLVLQELIHGPHTYPNDGGDRSHQLLEVVAALKCKYPDRVHLILGNHELSELTGRPIAKNGHALNAEFRRGLETAYGTAAGEVYKGYHELFRSLPLAVRTPNRVFLCHTLPEPAMMDRMDASVLETGIWTTESMARGGAVYALTWGRDTQPETADRFAQMVDCDYFITGHIPCREGFHRPNPRQLIIDGTPPCPACCLFPLDRPVAIEDLEHGVRQLYLSTEA
jgi:hypothetical protein